MSDIGIMRAREREKERGREREKERERERERVEKRREGKLTCFKDVSKV